MMGAVIVRSVKVTLPFLSTNTTELVLLGGGGGSSISVCHTYRCCHLLPSAIRVSINVARLYKDR